MSKKPPARAKPYTPKKTDHPGYYQVDLLTRNANSDASSLKSESYTVEAKNPRDAYHKAEKMVSPALTIVKVTIIFLGALAVCNFILRLVGLQ